MLAGGKESSPDSELEETDQTKLTLVIRIDVLPDDVLLEIFHFYVDMNLLVARKMDIEAWQLLVHVCGRWRSLVLASSCRLNLRLWCTHKTPVKDTLDVWPALPLLVSGDMAFSLGMENIIAALGQSSRIRLVDLYCPQTESRQLEKVLAAMQVPFPELTELQLLSDGETVPVIPGSFLGGSAPRLRHFSLSSIPFPGLPNLLLSATHLVDLTLIDIPHSGYISPQAMVVLLCALSSLETLSLEFRSPQSRPDQESRSLLPPKRSILPALYQFHFKGVTEYLEELVVHINASQLNRMHITFFNQIDFDCPRLAQFINCTPLIRALDEAHMQFDGSTARVTLRYRASNSSFDDLVINISCREPDWQLSSIEQICNNSLHPLSTVEDLYIERRYWERVSQIDAIENTLWLQLLLQFTATKNLYLLKKIAPDIAIVLKELVGERIAEVLPSLQNIFVEGLEPSGPFQENIEQFAAARQLSGHPIAISSWDKEPGFEFM